MSNTHISGRPTLAGLAKSRLAYGSTSSTYSKSIPPFGPQMACDIFGVNNYFYDDCEAIEDSMANQVVSDNSWYQPELPLENVRELEQRHLDQIKKFERAYRAMALHAMKWHYLMQEVEEDPQIAKMFNDMQMMRKLRGSNYV